MITIPKFISGNHIPRSISKFLKEMTLGFDSKKSEFLGILGNTPNPKLLLKYFKRFQTVYSLLWKSKNVCL